MSYKKLLWMGVTYGNQAERYTENDCFFKRITDDKRRILGQNSRNSKRNF